MTVQGAVVGENLVRLPNTRATAVKEKEGKLVCQPEVLCEGKPTALSADLSRRITFQNQLLWQALNYPESTMISTEKGTVLFT